MLYSGGNHLARLLRLPDPSRSGYLLGCGIMTVLSGAVNLLYLRLYDRLHVDWFGIEAARRSAAEWLLRVPPFMAGAVRLVIFLWLCIWINPLFSVLWARSGRLTYGMAQKDWGLFALAIAITNLGWIAMLGMAAFLLRIVVDYGLPMFLSPLAVIHGSLSK